MTMSICIPSFLGTKKEIKETLEKISIGRINDIQIKNKGKFKVGFIYLESWNLENPKINKIFNLLSSGEEINLVYNFPWFWKCRANHDISELKLKKLTIENKKTKHNLIKLKQELWQLQDYTKYLQQQNLKTP
jgi:hypothetical protein